MADEGNAEMSVGDHSGLLEEARSVARLILAGDITPFEGTTNIAVLCRTYAGPPPLELHTFVYADSEWEERPDDGSIFAEGVVAAAKDLVAGASDG